MRRERRGGQQQCAKGTRQNESLRQRILNVAEYREMLNDVPNGFVIHVGLCRCQVAATLTGERGSAQEGGSTSTDSRGLWVRWDAAGAAGAA